MESMALCSQKWHNRLMLSNITIVYQEREKIEAALGIEVTKDDEDEEEDEEEEEKVEGRLSINSWTTDSQYTYRKCMTLGVILADLT